MQAGGVCASLGALSMLWWSQMGVWPDLLWLVFVMIIIALVASKDAGAC